MGLQFEANFGSDFFVYKDYFTFFQISKWRIIQVWDFYELLKKILGYAEKIKHIRLYFLS